MGEVKHTRATREALEPLAAVVCRYATGMFKSRESMPFMPIEVFERNLREFYTEALVQRTYDVNGSAAKALPRSDGEGGGTLTEEVLLELQKFAEDWQDVSLEAIEAVALEVERRVLSCLSTQKPEASLAEMRERLEKANEALRPIALAADYYERTRPPKERERAMPIGPALLHGHLIDARTALTGYEQKGDNPSPATDDARMCDALREMLENARIKRERLESELRRAGYSLDEALTAINPVTDEVTYTRIQAAANRTRAALKAESSHGA